MRFRVEARDFDDDEVVERRQANAAETRRLSSLEFVLWVANAFPRPLHPTREPLGNESCSGREQTSPCFGNVD